MAERKMLAWIKEPDKEGFTKVRRSIPKIDDDSALVKVKAVGICGTDFAIYKGIRRFRQSDSRTRVLRRDRRRRKKCERV